MEIIEMVVLSVGNILCFLLGMRAGRREIVLPRMKTREKKEARVEKQRWETILRNIDNFDGTPFGQEDV